MHTANPDEQAIAGGSIQRASDIVVQRAEMLSPVGAWPSQSIPAHIAGPPGIKGLIKGLRRRWAPALIVGLTCAGLAAAAVWYLLPVSRYNAQALLRISAIRPKVVFKLANIDSLDSRSEFRTYQQTQEQYIKSRFVLNSALRDPKVGSLPTVRRQLDPAEWLGQKIAVTYNGEILTISMGGNDPKEIALLVNAVADAYMREVVSVEHNEWLELYSKLQSIYQHYQDTLKAKRESLKKLAELAGSNDKQTLAVKHQLAIERLGSAEKELTTLGSDLRKARAELDILQAEQNRARDRREEARAAMQAEQEALAADMTLKGQETEAARLRTQVDRARRLARSGRDPSVVNHEKQLAAVTAEIKERRQQIHAAVGERIRSESRGDGDAQRAVLLRKVSILAKVEASQRAEVERLTSGTRDLNKTTLDLETIRDDIENVEGISKHVGQEMEALNVELQAPARVRLVEKAEVPRQHNIKKQLAATGCAGAGTLLFVVLGIAWWDARVRRIDSADEVIRTLGMNLVGVVPSLPIRNGRSLANRDMARDHDSIILEHVEAVRTMITHAARAESLQVLMVASAMTAEGKTSLACRLAHCLARSGKRTLLVDCDLRKPSVHKVFNLTSNPGVCEVLRGEIDPWQAIQPMTNPRIENLSILPGGGCDAPAIQALVQGDLGRLLDRVRHDFDFIILDSAPVLAVADSLHVCQQADAVVFSIMRDVSLLPKVYTAYDRLARLGVRMLGAVIAGTSLEHYDSKYHHTIPQPGRSVSLRTGTIAESA